MAQLFPKAYLGGAIVPLEDATLNVASSAVLYGLSVYTVFPVWSGERGLQAFRLAEHAARLTNSARITGLDARMSTEELEHITRELVQANELKNDALIRVTIHASEQLPGVRSRGVATSVSAFAYETPGILPAEGARLKTSVWRRVSDFSIPARAKVNGAYVNSVLARQDALDSGYDDCIMLDQAGHVCELSAANIFMVRDGVLATPSASSDILEGISRKTVLEIADGLGIPTQERTIDLTELYIADEVFACGTSALLTPIIEIDKRVLPSDSDITKQIRTKYVNVLRGRAPEYAHFLTQL
jgi:branched-chain amino acid aminotransferase